jgi:hypothetical protein
MGIAQHMVVKSDSHKEITMSGLLLGHITACRKTRIDYFANAFELLLSSSKRSNSAICMQVAASFFRLLLFTEVSKEVSYSKMLSSTALKHWVVCLSHASPNRRHLIILR